MGFDWDKWKKVNHVAFVLDSNKKKKDKWDLGMYGSKKEKKDNSLIKPWKQN